MSQDEIIKLAKEAGFIFDKFNTEAYAPNVVIPNRNRDDTLPALIKFTELILASQAQPTSQDVVDAARYHCLCSMATNDYERSVGYQFVGKLNDFVDYIKPYADEALAERE